MPFRPLSLAALAVALGLAPALSGCDGETFVDPCVQNPSSCEPPGPEIVGGVNVSALLQPPSVSDLARARELWTVGAPVGYTGQIAMEVAGSNNERFYLLEARDAQADTLVALALARLPSLLSLPPSLPVLLIAPDGPAVTPAMFLTSAPDEPLASQWIQVIAVPRGGSVTLGSVTRTSPGQPSPYLLDVADALGALRAAQGAVPRARGRAAAIGFGKGGTVALLASIREPSIRAAASLAAPSDLFIGDVPDGIRAALDGRTASAGIPSFGTIAAEVIVPLQRGEITVDEARAQLFARSPAYFFSTIAPTVVFHGREDGVVEVVHGRRLDTALRGVPSLPGAYVETEDSHQSLFENFGVRNEAATHLSQSSQ